MNLSIFINYKNLKNKFKFKEFSPKYIISTIYLPLLLPFLITHIFPSFIIFFFITIVNYFIAKISIILYNRLEKYTKSKMESILIMGF